MRHPLNNHLISILKPFKTWNKHLHYLKIKLANQCVTKSDKYNNNKGVICCGSTIPWFEMFVHFKQLSERCTPRSGTSFANWKPFKNDEKCFLFNLKSSFRSQDIKFLSWLFGLVEKQLDEKNKIYFKTCDVINWDTNNCNTHIAQYLSK